MVAIRNGRKMSLNYSILKEAGVVVSQIIKVSLDRRDTMKGQIRTAIVFSDIQ